MYIKAGKIEVRIPAWFIFASALVAGKVVIDRRKNAAEKKQLENVETIPNEEEA